MREKDKPENRPVKGYYSNQHEGPDMDCCVCIRRYECERARDGTFCTQFRSLKFDPEGTDPNDLWKRGDPVEFDG